MPVAEPKILTHELDMAAPSARCLHCGLPAFDIDEDCPVLRLRAMAKAVGEGTAGEHIRAVRKWHSEEAS